MPCPTLFVVFQFLVVLQSLQTTIVSAQHDIECGVSQRRPWRSLSCREQLDYLEAVQEMKESGVYDEITLVHRNSGDDNHFVSTFLSFHRYLIWIFEKELQRIGGCFLTVPYWDWENGSRSRTLEYVLHPYSFGTPRRGCVRDGIAADWTAENNNGCLRREFDDEVDFVRDVQVLNLVTNEERFRDFAPAFEGAPHRGPHDYIGGPMADFWAPDDPLFHLHHANVDRIYALWQDYWDHDLMREEDMGRNQYDEDLDRPLEIQQGRNVNFNAPGRNRPPTPRELMLNRGGGILNVQYEDDNLALALSQTDSSYRNNAFWHTPGNAQTRGCPVEESQLRNAGDNGSPGSSFPLGECEGDCDGDSDCQGNLVCFQRSAFETVPGCGSGGTSGTDYCIAGTTSSGGTRGNPPLQFIGQDGSPSNVFPLGLCQGDCDSDNDCQGNLVCFQRVGSESVPGCASGGTDGNDYCISPSGSSSNLPPLQFIFQDGTPSGIWPLGECEGDCDSNADCEGSLVCYQRTDDEPVPGCAGQGHPSVDMCARPLNRLRRATVKDDDNDNDNDNVDSPPLFGSIQSQKRWSELKKIYPEDPARIFEILSAEDCAERAMASPDHIVRHASPKWLAMRNMTEEQIHLYDCHHVSSHLK